MHQLDGAVALQLAQTLARCTCTVLWLRSSLKAISFTLSPLTSRSKISRSRGVSTSSAVAGRSPPRSAAARRRTGNGRPYRRNAPPAPALPARSVWSDSRWRRRPARSARRWGVIDAEDDRAELRLLRPQAFQQAEAVFIRHGDVHHRDVDVAAQQCRRAAAALYCPTTSRSSSRLSNCAKPERTTTWSSTSITRIIFRTLLPNHGPMMPAAAVLAISQARLCNRCNRIVIKRAPPAPSTIKSMAKCCHSAARRSSSECNVVSWRW